MDAISAKDSIVIRKVSHPHFSSTVSIEFQCTTIVRRCRCCLSALPVSLVPIDAIAPFRRQKTIKWDAGSLSCIVVCIKQKPHLLEGKGRKDSEERGNLNLSEWY